MKTKTINVYTVKELSEGAKERAHGDWLEHFNNPWSSENLNTLNAFEKLFPVKVNDWSYGGRGEGVSFDMTIDQNVEDLTGLRLAKYIWNNYGQDLYRPKYIGNLEGRKKFSPVYSKVQREASCVLTGYCMDEDMLEPVYNFMKKPVKINFYELMTNCFDAWVLACSANAEDDASMEAFVDQADINDYEYDEAGRRI